MELITLATEALTLSLPFLKKSGEKIAENIGEEIWDLLKKPLSSTEDKILHADLTLKANQDILINELTNKLSRDPEFASALEGFVQKKQQELNNYAQQNICNNAAIGKQINMQSNSGNIQM